MQRASYLHTHDPWEYHLTLFRYPDREKAHTALASTLTKAIHTMITHTSSEKGRAVVLSITDANTISPFPFKVSSDLKAINRRLQTLGPDPLQLLSVHREQSRLVRQCWWGIAAVAEGVHVDSSLCANLLIYYQNFSNELCIHIQSLLISDNFCLAIFICVLTSVLHRLMNAATSLNSYSWLFLINPRSYDILLAFPELMGWGISNRSVVRRRARGCWEWRKVM